MVVIPVDGGIGGEGHHGVLHGNLALEIFAGGDGVANHDDAVKGKGVGAFVAAAGGNARGSGGTGAAVAFTDQIFGTGPAMVAMEPFFNEQQQCLGVLFNAVELLRTAFVQQYAIAGAYGVHQNDIRNVQQAVRVLDGRIGRQGGGAVRFAVEQPGGAQETRMDVHGGGAGAAVEAENHRAVGGIRHIGAEVGIGENGGNGLAGVVIEHIVLADGVIGDTVPTEGDLSIGFKFGRSKAGGIQFFSCVHRRNLLILYRS